MNHLGLTRDRRKFFAGASRALSMRAGLETPDHGNEFLTCSLYEITKGCLDVAGINYSGFDKQKIIGLSFNQPGADFPGILENVANKAVLMGYSEAPEPYTQLARIGNLADFKLSNRSGLGHAPSLIANSENQEVQTLQLQDRKQSIQLATYAARFGLSRHAIINDDLGEFGRMGARIGAAAKRTVGDQFAAIFTVNADGASIDEGSARIFASARNNTGTAGVPTTASFSEFRKLMGVQSDVSGNANLNIDPRYIYCPKTLEGACLVVAKSEREVVGAKTATTPNIEQGRWEIVSDARLDANSDQIYYGLADPNRYDTVEVAFLDGVDAPTVIRKQTTDILGVEFVAWIDCVAQALDFRAMAINDGA